MPWRQPLCFPSAAQDTSSAAPTRNHVLSKRVHAIRQKSPIQRNRPAGSSRFAAVSRSFTGYGAPASPISTASPIWT